MPRKARHGAGRTRKGRNKQSKPAHEGVFHVEEAANGLTLAAFLRAQLSGKSWSEVRRLLRSRRVQVHGNLCLDEGRRLKAGDVVKVLAQSAAPVAREHDLRIRFLDAHVVVVEKPAGVTSVRHVEELNWPARRRQLQPTLDELLPRLIAVVEGRGLARGRKTRGVPPPVRPVHRIDRDTSGLLVFARSVRAERHLGEQFRRHTTKRKYLAVVAGRIDFPRTIDTVILRDRGDGRRGSQAGAAPEQGKRAITHVAPLEHLGDYTLVECRLKTGRTHQIRIHLAESGHPICGDKVYRQPRMGAPILPDKSGAPRLALHAAELGFIHPATGKELHFSMPLPRELAQWLKRLREGKGSEESRTGK
ncbi:MAG: RluA family pseudouridine synthase [Planctomycetia bacterium]|nr:RluA family pseudouridine synthase [Planctomycetia bacterium]